MSVPGEASASVTPTDSPAAVMGAETPPGMLLPTRRKAIIMAALMVSLFLAALDQTIVAVALPQVVADLGGLDLFAWPLTSYLLASTVIFPVVGRLSDMYGRKPFLLAGIVVFLAGSALSGASGSMTELIAFRGVQGLGAGLIMANTFSLLGDLFSPAERGRWIGLFAAVWALASVVGPLVGGTLTDELSWRWVFYINLPVGAVAIPFVMWKLPWYRGRGDRRVDYMGGLLLIAAGIPLLLALSWAGNQFGWGEFPVVLSFTLAAVFTVLFVVAERRAGEYAVLPLSLFRNRVYVVSLLVVMMIGLALFGAAQFLPLFLQGAQGVSATNSGTVTFPMALGIVTGAVTSGQLLSRTGRFRPIAVTGGVLIALGSALLSTLTIDSSQNLARLYMAVLGLGIGLAMPLFAVAVQNAVPYRLLGVATASNQFFRQIGGTVGVAIFGSVMVTRFASRLSEAFPTGLGELRDSPQLLLDPERLDRFRASIDAQNPGASEAVVRAAREALAPAVIDLFVVTAVVMGLAVIAMLFLPRIRMRTQDDLLGTAPSQPAAPPPEAASEPPSIAAPPGAATLGGSGPPSAATVGPEAGRAHGAEDGLPRQRFAARRGVWLSAGAVGLVVGLVASIVSRDGSDTSRAGRRRTLVRILRDVQRGAARAVAPTPPLPPASRTERVTDRLDDALLTIDESNALASLRAARRRARRVTRVARRRLANAVDPRGRDGDRRG